jgi:beta propeller repeat protein
MRGKTVAGGKEGRTIPHPGLRPWPVLVILLLFLLSGAAQAAECLITVNTTESDQFNPAISGDRIAWEDAVDGSIHLYDIATGIETRVAPSGSWQTHPALGGSLLAWEETNDLGTLNITYRDLLAGSLGNLTTDGFSPVIDGQRILWIEGSSTTTLALWDEGTGATATLVTIDDPPLEHPALRGNRIAWVNGSETIIATKDLVTGDELLVTPGTDQVLHPVLSEDRVLWQDFRNVNWDLYLFNLTSGLETQITTGPADDTSPAAEGGRIVWVSGAEVYLLDLAGTDPPAAISSGGLMNDVPGISADRVVWQRFEDNGFNNIYLYTIGSALPCPAADFTSDTTSGTSPLTVQFTDISTGSPGNWLWEFGDGITSTDQNPSHTYAADGTYSVSLTVGNTVGRDFTSAADAIRVGPVPIVSFTANQTYGITPLPVRFTDTSSASPSSWSWDFGDGGTSADQNPVHLYAATGTYTVQLAATNVNGTGMREMTDLIRVLNGVNLLSTTDIPGLQVTDAGGRQEITLDTGLMDGYSFDPASPASFSFTPPASSGWQNVTFSSTDGISFAEAGGILRGNLSSCILESRGLTPTTFTTDVGNNLPLSYRLVLGAFPVLADVNATVWEGVTPEDDLAFSHALEMTSPEFVHILDTAYTLDFVSTNLTGVQGATLNLSVSNAWVARNGNQNNITTVRLGSDGIDETLNPTATFTDNTGTIQYYSIPSPHGLSRFAFVSAAGSSNLIQMGARVATQVIQGSGGRGSGSSDQPSTRDRTSWEQPPAAAQPPSAPAVPTFYGEGPIDSTSAGITREAVIISSEDREGSLLVPAGIEALDAGKAPLSRVMVSPAAGAIPAGTGPEFTGMLYDLGPDGATFNPPATVSFAVPGDLWDPDARYSIRTYAAQAGSWEDIPTSVDTGNRIVSGSVSHLCLFGLFAAGPPAVTPAVAGAPAAIQGEQPKPLPRSPLSTFTGMLGWAATTASAHSLAALAILIAVLASLYAFSRRAWLSRHRTWITLYLISLTGLLWAAFLFTSGGPSWEYSFLLITVAGLNLIVHAFRFDRIELSPRAPRGYPMAPRRW